MAVEEGQKVSAGDEIASFRTVKVYAPEDGTVTGVFAEPGDDAETVANTYGAVLYIEGNTRYSISASTSKAYSSVETKFVHSGEKVYLQCRGTASRTGEGIVTAVDGSSYTVLVTSGDFIASDSIDIYRDSDHTTELRIGRGSITRFSPTAVTATGAIVSVAVKDGDTVHKGDLLLETLDGTFDAYEMTGASIMADQDGIIASLSVSAGTALTQDSVAAEVYPMISMRITASVTADERKDIKVGDKVKLELESDESKVYDGTVSFVSALPTEGEEETTCRVLIDFTPDDAVTFGMSVIVTTPEEDDEAEEPEEKDAAEETEEETEERTREKKREMPEGAFADMQDGFPSEMPEGFPAERAGDAQTETDGE